LRFEKGRSSRRTFSSREAPPVAEIGVLRIGSAAATLGFFGVERRREAEGAASSGAFFFENFSAF
jgi:hypothetical protein